MITAITPTVIEGAGADATGAMSAAVLPGAVPTTAREVVHSGFGVSLDEGMMSQIRHQNSYTAVAKMVTSAEDMLRAIVGMTL